MPLLDRKQIPGLQPTNRLPSSGRLRDTNAQLLLKHAQLCSVARTAMMTRLSSPQPDIAQCENGLGSAKDNNRLHSSKALGDNLRSPQQKLHQNPSHGAALTDTPLSTAPNSPRM